MASPKRSSGCPPKIDADRICERVKGDLIRRGKPELHIAVVGKTGAGKTALASAVVTDKSGSSGSFGPFPGTTELVAVKKCELNGVSIYVYDTRGLCDGSVSIKEVTEALQQQCPADKLDLVIACFKWSDRLDDTNKRVFPAINELGSNIWKKTVIALTFCDFLPPEIKRKSDNDKFKSVNQKWSEWENAIKTELNRLRIEHEVVCNIKICPTTHTDEKIDKCFSSVLARPWLVNLWIDILENGKNYPDVCRHHNLHLATVAILNSDGHSSIIAALAVFSTFGAMFLGAGVGASLASATAFSTIGAAVIGGILGVVALPVAVLPAALIVAAGTLAVALYCN